MITKILFGAAITLGVAAAAPAAAEPSPFGALGCSCKPPVVAPDGQARTKDQMDQGIQNGLGIFHGTSPRHAHN